MYIPNPNYGNQTQNYFRNITTERLQRKKRNLLQNGTVDYHQNININVSISKGDKKKILNRMQSHFQSTDPEFKIKQYLINKHNQTSAIECFNCYSPYGNKQKKLLSQRYNIMNKTYETQKKISRYIEKISQTFNVDNNFKNEQYIPRKLPQQIDVLNVSNNDSSNQDISEIKLINQLNKSHMLEILELEQQLPQIRNNPLGRLFEKYEDLINSDYNQLGKDMKVIFNNRLQQQRITEVKTYIESPKRIQRAMTVSENRKASTPEKRSQGQAGSRTNRYYQSFNSRPKTTHLIERINQIKLDLNQQVSQINKVKGITGRSFIEQKRNFNKKIICDEDDKAIKGFHHFFNNAQTLELFNIRDTEFQD